MGKSTLNMLLVIAIMVASMGFHGSVAKEHIVGDGFGWNVPSSQSFYHSWASHQTFEANDVLVFNFATGTHTVAQVSRTAYNACDGSNPISLHTTSPARITIDPNQEQFYICTVGSHCKSFQKLDIWVSTSTNNSSTMLPH
ncbi:hypothetical protein L1987_20903 [Smallanthus sonchifolius]|uniref:Uncharacterized protein n=1 Tax=Smallanthus sonchifolius TaxID=185202 RepID=A0ACB9IT51_9ASTR|nr:hypothetical protein L1987_20903 [Smallanthus sonchifolius]